MNLKRIAIIGAGLSGLTLANHLRHHAEVSVFEKARGVGGRMSTRRAKAYCFDHGTAFFTARNKHFKQFLAPYLISGLVQPWQGKVVTLEKGKKITDRLWFEPHYVATPSMNGLCKQLAKQISIHLNCEIAPLLDKNTDSWRLFNKQGESLGDYDWLISTAPPIQTCHLLDKYIPPHAILRQSKFLACYALMLGWQKPWDKTWIGANILNSPLAWLGVNSSKPTRNHNLTTLVAHTHQAWAEEHVEDDQAMTEIFLRDELQQILNLDMSQIDYCSLHRWRYAALDKKPDDKTHHKPYFDQEKQLAAVGDWCSLSRIEDVWLKSHELAVQIQGYL